MSLILYLPEPTETSSIFQGFLHVYLGDHHRDPQVRTWKIHRNTSASGVSRRRKVRFRTTTNLSSGVVGLGPEQLIVTMPDGMVVRLMLMTDTISLQTVLVSNCQVDNHFFAQCSGALGPITSRMSPLSFIHPQEKHIEMISARKLFGVDHNCSLQNHFPNQSSSPARDPSPACSSTLHARCRCCRKCYGKCSFPFPKTYVFLRSLR